MPRYDFTPAELTDLARYIHYLRQTGRYADLTAAPREGGNSGAAGLRARVLRPPAFASIEGSATAERRTHLQLLEQHSEMDFANLLAYLETAAR
jgi:hypothetical protein